MSILGSGFGRALGAAGQAASNWATVYIDEQSALRKAERLAELQRTNAVQTEKDIDAYRNDPTRRKSLREQAGEDARAAGDVALGLKRTEATDPALREAETKRAGDLARAGAKASTDVQREDVIARGSDPLYLEAQKKLAAAQRQPESAGSIAQAALANFQLTALRRVDELRQQLQEAVATGNKGAEEALREQLDVFESKPGKTDKLRKAIEDAEKSIGPALKILANPMSDPISRKEAEETVRGARGRIDAYSKQLGLDTTKPAVEVPAAAAAHLKANPKLAAEFDVKYGKGEADKVLGAAGGAPAPRAGVPLAKQAERIAPPERREATELDGAKLRLREAEAALQRFGSRQRQQDPSGFSRAQAAVDAARAEEQTARAAYDASFGSQAPGAAVRYPTP